VIKLHQNNSRHSPDISKQISKIFVSGHSYS